MYAVIQSGGKQYRVQPGDILQVEKLEGDVGASVKFDQVLFLSNPGSEKSDVWLGKPLVANAAVEGEIVGQGRGDKITIFKMKRRKQYRKTQGHRQYYTQVLVTAVDNGSGAKASLSADDKKAKLSKFQSHLAPKGQAFTPKTLGSRKRRIEAAAKGEKPAAEAAAPKKAPVKKTAKAKK